MKTSSLFKRLLVLTMILLLAGTGFTQAWIPIGATASTTTPADVPHTAAQAGEELICEPTSDHASQSDPCCSNSCRTPVVALHAQESPRNTHIGHTNEPQPTASGITTRLDRPPRRT